MSRENLIALVFLVIAWAFLLVLGVAHHREARRRDRRRPPAPPRRPF